MKRSFLKVVPSALLALACFAGTPACVGVDMELEDETVALEAGGSQLSLEWLIVADDELISCVDAGATEIEIAVIGESEERQRISCFGGYAVVDGLSPGPALIEVSLVDPEGNLLVTAELGEVDVQAGVTNPLGAIELGM